MFGRLKTQDGRFNIKLYMLLPLIETLRVLALARGVAARSSQERAEALLKTGTVPPEVGQFSEDIHICLRLLLRQQIDDISSGLAPSSKIKEDYITASDKQLLKSIQGRIRHLEPLLQACLFDS